MMTGAQRAQGVTDMEVEFWRASGHTPGLAADLARHAERAAFDGLSFGDTQCLSADPFVGLTVAAGVTERLKLAVRVTNPVTRLPALAASAAATVQVVSDGRVVLGVGRGDSAVSRIGLRPATPSQLEEWLVVLQSYLRGDNV